jgi:GAF domain-containing protein
VVAATVSAAFGPASLRLGDVIAHDELGRVFRTWTLSDMSGVLVVAPAILTWAKSGFTGIQRRGIVEGAAVLAVLLVLTEYGPQRDVPYIVFPVLLWAALRFGPRGAATAILVVCSVTVWNTAQNDGPFVRESITDSLLSTQLFIAIAALTSLLLAAVTAERTRAERTLAAAEAAQRALADEQAALRRVATLVAGEAAPSEVFEQVTEEVGRLLDLPSATVLQFHGAHRARVVGAWSNDGAPPFPLGAMLELDGDTVVGKVLRTGSPARVDRYEEARGTLAETMRDLGYGGAVAAPVSVGGRPWGALASASPLHKPLPDGVERRLCDFADLVAQALANADAYEKLAASRARVVEIGDAERQRLERNLHDGAQQRLVAVALALSMVNVKLQSDPAAAQQVLSAARDDLAQGLDELRELARGIHPAVPHRTRPRPRARRAW